MTCLFIQRDRASESRWFYCQYGAVELPQEYSPPYCP